MLEKIASRFALGRLTDAKNLMEKLEEAGIPNSEFIDYVKKKNEIRYQASLEAGQKPRQAIKNTQKNIGKEWGDVIYLRCPECNGSLMTREIRVPQGKRNIHGYKVHQACNNENCMFEKFYK